MNYQQYGNTYGYVPQPQNNGQMGMPQQPYPNNMNQPYPNQMQYNGQQYPNSIGQQYQTQMIPQYPGQAIPQYPGQMGMQQYPNQIPLQYNQASQQQFSNRMTQQIPNQMPLQYPNAVQMQNQQMLRASQPINNVYAANTQNPAMPQFASSQYLNGGMAVNQVAPVKVNNSNIPQMFIPQLTQPPTIGYIPPPPGVLGQRIENSKQKVYTNLYSSLAALNVIFDLFSNSIIDEKVRDQVFDQQMSLLEGNMGPGNINTVDQLKQFAQMADLDILYCEKRIADRINKTEQKPQVGGSSKFFVQFGESLTNFDTLLLLIETPEKYRDLRIQVQSQLRGLIRNYKKIPNQVPYNLNILEQYFNFVSQSDNMDMRTIQRMKTDLSNVLKNIKNSLQ